jgi:hypothetical protein
MKILMEFTTLNYLMWHGMAMRLKEIYPHATFAGFIGVAPGGEYAHEFLKNQKDIKYEFLLPHWQIVRESLDGDIDWSLLREFEEGLPEKSIWRIVASDRGWGSDYLHDVIMKSTFISDNNSRENILKVLSGGIKRYSKVFKDFKPDMFLPAICQGSMSVHIFSKLCRDYGLPYIMPSFVRIHNIYGFATDVPLNFTPIDETYRRLMEGSLKVDMGPAEKLYEELMSEFEDSKNFDRHLPGIKVVRLTSWKAKAKVVFLMFKSILGTTRSWIKMSGFNRTNDVRRQTFSLKTWWSNIRFYWWFHYQKLVMLDPKLGAPLPAGQKYIYYPLHTAPEYSTNFQATMWMDQLANIEFLAKSIPHDWIVYVKEHPATLLARVRPLDFFQRIQRLPNVRLAPLDANTHHIISNAQMVAVVTGTSGWEAIQRGVPVLTFTTNNFDCLGLSRVCSEPEKIAFAIREELARHKTITAEERKKRLTCYLAAVLERGFKITYPALFSYDDVGKLEEYYTCGRELTEALMKHLEYLQENKEYALR